MQYGQLVVHLLYYQFNGYDDDMTMRRLKQHGDGLFVHRQCNLKISGVSFTIVTSHNFIRVFPLLDNWAID